MVVHDYGRQQAWPAGDLHSGQMEADGYAFYLSVNGVWLTKNVPMKYMHKEV